MKLVITQNWWVRKNQMKTPATYEIPNREISVEDAKRCVKEGAGFIPEEEKPKRKAPAPENKVRDAAPENKSKGVEE